ncbi:MAG: sensor domain-containing diguanylate cyclase [Deltaproteobacteria bacterium]|nr:sensor domain-containing diguanylate cyclase [Deltaproteobacteria bacterium]MBW2306134.1 sensor domain-containing diguanylate cyclase [Deltaproteobacteria bacterium]
MPPSTDKIADARDRIIRKLSHENKELKHRLAQFMENAKYNENIMANFDEIEKIVLSSQTIQELLRVFTKEIRKRFGLEYVQVRLTDYLKNTFWSLTQLLGPNVRNLSLLEEKELTRYLSVREGPVLASDPPGEWKEYFFGKDHRKLKSMAVIPLREKEKLLGCLCLGSRSPKRYEPGNQTMLLKRLGTMVAIGLKNTIAHQQLEQMAVRDMLTGLYNRHYLNDKINAEFQRVERYNHPLSCAVIDLDGLKNVNDQFGHAEGDRLLRCVADTLRTSVRKADAVIRTGGDEFLILFPSTDLQNAVHALRNIIRRLKAAEFRTEGRLQKISASIGVAVCPHPKIRSADELISAADHRMYLAKKKGGARVEWREEKS